MHLQEHIEKTPKPRHRLELQSVARLAKEKTGLAVHRVRVDTQQAIGGLGICVRKQDVTIATELVKDPKKIDDAAATLLHEGLHASGTRQNGKQGHGIDHEGIVELEARRFAKERGYTNFSRVYEGRVQNAKQIADLIGHKRMVEIADQPGAVVQLRRAMVNALVKKNWSNNKAEKRAEELERAAA